MRPPLPSGSFFDEKMLDQAFWGLLGLGGLVQSLPGAP